jgi:hypothetical protein
MYTLQELTNYKYYHTIILYNGEPTITINPIIGDYCPSQRELDNAKITLDEWKKDKDLIGPNHYETQSTYQLALKIIRNLNKE